MVDVNDYLNNRQGSPSNKPLLPLIFSGDAWLVKQSWDDVVIDGSTNKPSSSGKKLKEVYAELYDTGKNMRKLIFLDLSQTLIELSDKARRQ